MTTARGLKRFTGKNSGASKCSLYASPIHRLPSLEDFPGPEHSVFRIRAGEFETEFKFRTKKNPRMIRMKPGIRAWGRYALVLNFALVFNLCGSMGARPTVAETMNRADPVWHPIALFLAGMDLPAGDDYAAIQSSPVYQNHVRTMDLFWDQVRTKNIREIEPWRTEVLKKSKNTVLYPLSGADFINAHAFFPDAERYVMIALESPGTAPDPRTMNPRQMVIGLAAVRAVIASIASRNYLYSASMRTYMRGVYPYSGVLPVLLLFNARLGHVILGVDHVGLDGKGRVYARTEGSDQEAAVQGVRVRFAVPGESGDREILYWNIPISNAAVDPAAPSGRYLRSLTHTRVIMKAAIYLLHRPDMNAVRDWLLDSADLVFQCDSGLPFRAFDSEHWKVDLYGNYVTAAHFPGLGFYHQPDLAAAYVYDRKPLHFHFGYGLLTRARTSNIQIARKIRS